jgi:hypothetical protein
MMLKNEQIQPKTDEVANEIGSAASQPFKKSVEKIIEQLVDKSIDAFIENMKSSDTQPEAKTGQNHFL